MDLHSSMPKIGIYQFTCTANGDRYIGSSRYLARRRREHVCSLRAGTHHNRHLQAVWNKYGEATFLFEVLEAVDDARFLIEREQYWIDSTNPEINKAQRAESGFLGRKHTDETRARLAAIQRERMQSPERRERLREAALQQKHNSGWVPSHETKAKLREATRQQFATPESRADHGVLTKAAMTPERIERMRQTKIGRRATDETRARMSASHREYYRRKKDGK